MKLATVLGASFSNSSNSMSPLVVFSSTRGRLSALASASRMAFSLAQAFL